MSITDSGGLFSSLGSFSSFGEDDVYTSDFDQDEGEAEVWVDEEFDADHILMEQEAGLEEEVSLEEEVILEEEVRPEEEGQCDEEVHLEEGQLIAGCSFPSFKEAIRSMEEFCDKTFSSLVIRGSDDGTKLDENGQKKKMGRIQFWCAHGYTRTSRAKGIR